MGHVNPVQPRSAASNWWGRSRGLPARTYEDWRGSLLEVAGRTPRILAWARSPTGFCIGSPAALSIGDETGFTHLGWHEIEHGGWNSETLRLSWVRYPSEDGRSRRGFVELIEPARLPELFRERVAASIVFERFVPLTASDDGGVTISGRRDLAGSADRISWHASPTRGVNWRDDAVRAEADQMLERMRIEYDTTPAGW
jgi:hypothetical protein